MNGTHCSQIGHSGLCCSEFLPVNGTHCSQIGKLGLFCTEFLSVNGTHCSQNGILGLFCSEFLSVNGTHCSQIGILGGLFCSEFLSVNGTHCSQIGILGGLFCSEFLSVYERKRRILAAPKRNLRGIRKSQHHPENAAFNELLPVSRRRLRRTYLKRLKCTHHIKHDAIHGREVMETLRSFID